METTRRNFFAMLFAPFVARFMPKPTMLFADFYGKQMLPALRHVIDRGYRNNARTFGEAFAPTVFRFEHMTKPIDLDALTWKPGQVMRFGRSVPVFQHNPFSLRLPSLGNGTCGVESDDEDM